MIINKNKKKIILGSLGIITVGVGAGLPIATTAKGQEKLKLSIPQKVKKNKTEIKQLLQQIKALHLITNNLQSNQYKFKKLIGQNSILTEYLRKAAVGFTAHIREIKREIIPKLEKLQQIQTKQTKTNTKTITKIQEFAEDLRKLIVRHYKFIIEAETEITKLKSEQKESKKVIKNLTSRIVSLEKTTDLNNKRQIKSLKIRGERITKNQEEIKQLQLKKSKKSTLKSVKIPTSLELIQIGKMIKFLKERKQTYTQITTFFTQRGWADFIYMIKKQT